MIGNGDSDDDGGVREALSASKALLAMAWKAVDENSEQAPLGDVQIVVLAAARCSVAAAAGRLRRPRGAVDEAIVALETQRFLVVEDIDDEPALRLLPRGRRLIDDISTRYRGELQRALTHLGEDTRRELVELLSTFSPVDGSAPDGLLTLGLRPA